jgi:hypothetical protein
MAISLNMGWHSTSKEFITRYYALLILMVGGQKLSMINKLCGCRQCIKLRDADKDFFNKE